MEPEIHSVLPNGSPLLAYGEQRLPRRKLIGRIAFGFFSTLFVVLFGWLLIGAQIELPAQTFVTAVVPAHTQLPDAYPVLWKIAAKSSSSPMILGFFANDTQLVPFTIGSRFDPVYGVEMQTQGLLLLQSTKPIGSIVSRPLRSFVAPLFSLFRHEAFVRVDLNVFGTGLPEVVEGSVDRGVWTTQIVVNQSGQLLPLPLGDIRLSLQALPEAWTFVQEALTRSAMPVVLDERPEAMSWSETATSSSLILRFANEPATSTQLALASAAGWYDVAQRSLPDGTMAQELLTPEKKIAIAQVSSTAPNSAYAASGTVVQIGALDPQTLSLQQVCGSGTDIFSLKGQALQQLVDGFGLHQEAMFTDLLLFADPLGKVGVCLR